MAQDTTLFTLLPEEEIDHLSHKVSKNETPLWSYWSEFVNQYLVLGRSKTTVRNVRDALRFLLRNTDFLSIEQCNNNRELQRLLIQLKQDREWTGCTYNSYLKNLKTYFIWLESVDYIDENRLLKVAKSKEEQNEQITHSEEQVQAIVKHIRDRRQSRLERSRNVFFIDLLRFSGARPCELVSLKVDDVKPYKGSYRVRLNGAKQKGKPRYYNLPSVLRDSYESYMIQRNKLRPDEDNLFISLSKRTGWTKKGMTSLLKRLSKELNFRIVSYGFRRYVASSLYEETKDMRVIGDFLGHTRASTTLGYVASTCARTKEAGDIMARRLNSTHASQSTSTFADLSMTDK